MSVSVTCRPMMRLLTFATLLSCAFAFTTVRAQDRGPQKIVKEGVEIEFTIEPSASKSKAELMAGQDTVFRFKLRDAVSKTPISGLRPAAWAAQRERPGAPGPEHLCLPATRDARTDPASSGPGP